MYSLGLKVSAMRSASMGLKTSNNLTLLVNHGAFCGATGALNVGSKVASATQ